MEHLNWKGIAPIRSTARRWYIADCSEIEGRTEQNKVEQE